MRRHIFILGDSRGKEVAARIDATIGKLPGLGCFDRLTRLRQEAIDSLGVPEPQLLAMTASH